MPVFSSSQLYNVIIMPFSLSLSQDFGWLFGVATNWFGWVGFGSTLGGYKAAVDWWVVVDDRSRMY